MKTDIRKDFAQALFEVADSPSGDEFEVKKAGCQWMISKDQKRWITAGAPLFNVRGTLCELEDRGFQKFWFRQGKRFPIHLKDLRTFHRFIEEVRTLLGEAELYNQSLGSTCARTVYDRLDGRPDR